MKEYLKIYVDKLFTYLPVAIFIFTIVFFININQAVSDLKTEFGINAIDELIDIYEFYFVRTTLLTLFIPFYDVVLSNNKLTYKKAVILHYLLINVTVAGLYYRVGAPIESILMMVVLCTIIYVSVRLIIHLREKQFVTSANKIFMENKNSND